MSGNVRKDAVIVRGYRFIDSILYSLVLKLSTSPKTHSQKYQCVSYRHILIIVTIAQLVVNTRFIYKALMRIHQTKFNRVFWPELIFLLLKKKKRERKKIKEKWC